MNKLFESIMDDPAGAAFLMFIGTLCLCFLLVAVSATYIGIHEAVNQCHIQEEL